MRQMVEKQKSKHQQHSPESFSKSKEKENLKVKLLMQYKASLLSILELKAIVLKGSIELYRKVHLQVYSLMNFHGVNPVMSLLPRSEGKT